jgi:protein-L-isoaspartate(D-aspartate) O-methyltransferase
MSPEEKPKMDPATGEKQSARLVRLLLQQGIPRGVVLDAVRYVPREMFVPRDVRDRAWENHPLDIGFGQTISEPYTVAHMLELAEVAGTDRVLEVGSGSGYVLALLAYIVGSPSRVTGIEINGELCARSKERLARLGLEEITVVHADGREGYAQNAPYDVIIVSAQTGEIPPLLVDQLGRDGRMVVPIDVGSYAAMTVVRHDEKGGVATEGHGAFRFVPLVSG